MIISGRIKERAVQGSLIMLLILTLGVYRCVSQSFEYNPHATGVTNAGKDVKHLLDVNLNAKSSPMSTINTGFEELKPALTPCGKKLYFSRFGHPENATSKYQNEDIWYSAYDEETKVWSEGVRLPGILNNGGHNFVNSISVTGDTLILGNHYLKNGKMKAGLSYSVNFRGQWQVPINIIIANDYNISDQSNAFVSLKTGVIIQAIERSETEGSRDLYVSFWNGHHATEPVNMGKALNTSFEESSPYLASDNKTLYFASKGHNGYGGYDIFVTRRLDESWTSWSEPQNLGPAVNGILDDEHFSISHCGNYGVFSKQVSIHNTDLYKISLEELFIGDPNGPMAKRYNNTSNATSALAFMK